MEMDFLLEVAAALRSDTTQEFTICASAREYVATMLEEALEYAERYRWLQSAPLEVQRDWISRNKVDHAWADSFADERIGEQGNEQSP